MRIVTFKRIQEYSELHPDSDTPLRNWYNWTKETEWNSFSDMR